MTETAGYKYQVGLDGELGSLNGGKYIVAVGTVWPI